MTAVEREKNQVYFFSEVFIRLVSLVFLFAFVDSYFQFKDLIGVNGYSPVEEFLSFAFQQNGRRSWFQFPSLFWFSASDLFISIVFLAGTISSVLAFFGRFSSINLLISFLCWISIINTGSDFFLYVWDTLLAEAGFIALLISLLNRDSKFNKIVVFTLWLFAFRLWFSMGIVTVLYNNTVPLNGTFIKYFLQNQPMPTSFAFYLYHLPDFAHTLISRVLLVVEIFVPFLIFFRKTRFVALLVFFFFSFFIFLIGNYAWFNILTLVICVPLLMNTNKGERICLKFNQFLLNRNSNTNLKLNRFISYILCYQVALQSLSLIFLFFPIGNRYLNFLNYYNYQPEFINWQEKSIIAKVLTAPIDFGSDFKISNPYGVFKGIPVKRWECQFELCQDTVLGPFHKIDYHYKPGLSNSFSFFAPHHPRLEQQLFYEAQQGSFYRNYTPYQHNFNNSCWTNGYLKALFRNFLKEKKVDAEYVKVSVLEMSFSNWEDYQKSGNQWNKKVVVSYFVTNKSINCPLIPDDYFRKYKKHLD